ncbi:MAG TPA: amidohydrolase [Gemmatimonadales bacterium]|nr:amidohydrolase [Gemmatimonadales bacterium]
MPSNSSAQQAGLDPAIAARIDAIESRVIAWRRDIHQHPELGNREFRTAALVAAHLRSLGIEVDTGVAHTGVVGLLRGAKPGPVVLLRADMDALPVTERNDLPFRSDARTIYNDQEVGVMHACGHDTHVAILMGVAEILAGMRSDLAGTIKFVFQPAEEGAPHGEEGGAELMVKEGVLTDPPVDAAFALHIASLVPAGDLVYTRGGTWASSDDFRIVVRGRQTHGAYPWGGVDPIVTAAHIITGLQTIVSRRMDLAANPSVVTVGKITGGNRSNIIPEEVELIGTVRALNVQDRALLHERVRQVASGIAEGMGATAEVSIPYSGGYPVTVNDDEILAMMIPVLEAVAGPGRAREVKARLGAEDFSFIAQEIPSLYIQLGGMPRRLDPATAPAHHTPDFVIEESALIVGVKAMTAMALHYLENGK